MYHIDYVKIDEKVECPICGNALDNFETKNGPGALLTLDFKAVDRFYSRCGKCHNSIDFSLKNPVEDEQREKLTIDSYRKKGKIY